MIKEIILDKKAFRLKVSRYLREYHNYSGRSLRNIEIYLDDKRIRSSFKLPNSGILKIIEKEKGTNIIAKKMKLDILYEDDDLLILNKPPFLLTHPTLKKSDMSLANAVVYYYLEKYNKELVPRFISRLDMNTSGIIAIAKNAFTQSFLQLNKDKTEKIYLAIVEGIVDFEDKVVDAPIYYDGINLERKIDILGKEAKTSFKTLKTYKHLGVSVILCKLFTGRTHQIRVHLKYIGHPIIGDELYAPNSKYLKIVKRQMLHSHIYSFLHPRTLKTISIKSDMYKDMEEILNENN